MFTHCPGLVLNLLVLKLDARPNNALLEQCCQSENSANHERLLPPAGANGQEQASMGLF